MMGMRAKRLLTSAAAAAALVTLTVRPAWAPTVGQPPARGYPPCTIVGDRNGRATNDVIRGTNHRDVICPDEGNDVVYGRGGHDVIFGGKGVDRLYGGPGDDEFHAWQGGDKLFGDSGNDDLNGELGDDLVVGGKGRDVLKGAEDADCLVATDGVRRNDEVKGMNGIDRYEADQGDRIGGSTERRRDCYRANNN
jgi:RTX calcium-binding nonapeptide repeat (4 copies)